MIFDTAYDTSSAPYNLKTILSTLQLAMASYELKLQNNECHTTGKVTNLWLLMDTGLHSKTCPVFNHPVVIYTQRDDNSAMVLDVRQFGSTDKATGAFKYRSGSEVSWALTRAYLNGIWIEEGPKLLQDLSTIPMSAYSAMISQTITRRYNLEPADQVNIAILAGYFYLGLYEDAPVADETDLMKTAVKIARATHLPTAKVFDRIKDLGAIDSIEEFCHRLKDFVGNIRLKDFNTAMLLQITCGNWFGPNGRENMAISLEHPPTWLAICYHCLSDATSMRSPLAKLVQQQDRSGEGERFIRAIDALVNPEEVSKAISGEPYSR